MASETDEFGARLVEKRTNRHGFVTWYKIEVFHHGLSEVRTVGDSDFDVVKRKANALLSKMTDKWAKMQAQEHSRAQTLGGKVSAENRTAAATADLDGSGVCRGGDACLRGRGLGSGRQPVWTHRRHRAAGDLWSHAARAGAG